MNGHSLTIAQNKVAYKLDWLINKKKFGPELLRKGFIKRQFPQDMEEKSSETGRDSNDMPPGVLVYTKPVA